MYERLISHRPITREYSLIGRIDSSSGSTTSWNSMITFAFRNEFIRLMSMCMWATDEVHHCSMMTSGFSCRRNLNARYQVSGLL